MAVVASRSPLESCQPPWELRVGTAVWTGPARGAFADPDGTVRLLASLPGNPGADG